MPRKKRSEVSTARSKRNRNQQPDNQYLEANTEPDFIEQKLPPLRPKNDSQAWYMDSINQNVITFATGPAGTGKTFIVTSMAAEMLADKRIDRIIITRPAVEAGDEKFGFLPGELSEKFAPYLAPFMDVLERKLGKRFVAYLLKQKRIEAMPLAFMRGQSFRNSLIILDEAQNTTPGAMKMFLTRIGEGSRMVINGDIRQKDIKGVSGLEDGIDKIGSLKRVGVVEFGREDIVRHDMVQKILDCYEGTAA